MHSKHARVASNLLAETLHTERHGMQRNHYDFLIVGAGITSAVFAHEAAKIGKTCLVIDRRDHIAGNIYTEEIDGINVHKYGAISSIRRFVPFGIT